MEVTIQVLYFQKKGTHLNILERLFIHKKVSFDNHVRDKHTVFPNIIFGIILKNENFS